MDQIRGLIASLLLFITILVCNLVQTLSLIVRPFSQRLFRRINRGVAYCWWGLCDVGAQRILGVQVIVTGDDVPLRENSIVVLNHQTMTDIPVLFALARSKGRLGDLKWFVKDVIKYFPGVGWGMLFLDCLFIKRDWLADRTRIHRVFEKILKYSVPLWLVTFVEGTRHSSEKIKKSQDYARKQGLTPLHHVQIPRTKGFVASVQALRTHLDAVYDLTIGYVKKAPSLWEWVKGDVRRVHLHVRRFPIATVPAEDAKISDWLMTIFWEKDQLLDQFTLKGSF